MNIHTRVIEGVYADPLLPRVLSARAEAMVDVEHFARLLGTVAPSGRCRVFVVDRTEPTDEIIVEVHTTNDVTYELALSAARLVPDGHVLLQTLRPVPIGRNSLARNYERT
jgi:hypothetical protein